MEAAAIDETSASPDTTAVQSQPQSIRLLPSTKTSFGRTGSALTARVSAHSEARRMLSRSMRCDRAEGHRHLRRGADFLVQLLARFRIELLGIVEAARDALGVENDRRRRHRAGERSPARLVAAGDREDALVERAALAPEARAQLRLVERQALR